jgi:hypothetical protein
MLVAGREGKDRLAGSAQRGSGQLSGRATGVDTASLYEHACPS